MLFPKSILRIQILLPVRVVRIRIHFTNITDHFTVESALYENSQVEEKLRKFKYCRLEKYYKMSTSSGNLESHIKSKHNIVINSKLGRKKLSKAERDEINKNLLLFLIFCYLSFSIVMNKYFKNFIASICKNTDYELPCRETLNSLLKELYNQ